jgi:hypothetical protein
MCIAESRLRRSGCQWEGLTCPGLWGQQLTAEEVLASSVCPHVTVSNWSTNYAGGIFKEQLDFGVSPTQIQYTHYLSSSQQKMTMSHSGGMGKV